MPKFTPSSAHQGIAVFSNPKSVGFDYWVALCMGATLTEMAVASFHLDAGQSISIVFPTTIPATLGTYPVNLKITSGSMLASKSDESIIVEEEVITYRYYIWGYVSKPGAIDAEGNWIPGTGGGIPGTVTLAYTEKVSGPPYQKPGGTFKTIQTSSDGMWNTGHIERTTPIGRLFIKASCPGYKDSEWEWFDPKNNQMTRKDVMLFPVQ